MRRILSIGLLLALLAGCAPQEAESPSPTPTAPEAAPSGPLVQTDWSRLEPRQAEHTSLYTRRYAGWTDSLIPAKDYGRLYPFAGEPVPARERYMGEADVGSDTTLYKYGLVSETGEVVVDPVYDLVGPPCDRFLDGPSFYHPMPDLLLLGRLEAWTPQEETDYEGPWAWRWRYGAAASDGSWVTDLVYTDYSAADGNTLLLTAESGEITVLDVSGKVRFTIPAGEGSWSPQMLSWSEGFVVSGPYSDEHYFYDARTGERRFGPYASAQPFSQGLAAVRDNKTGLYGYIDTAGAWAIPPAFEEAESFRNGAALVRVIGGLPALVDRTGSFLVEANEGQIATCGLSSYGSYNGDRQLWYLHCTTEDEQGQVTVLGAYGGDGSPLAAPAAGEKLDLWWGSECSKIQGDTTIYYANGAARTLPLPGVVRGVEGDYVILQRPRDERYYDYALVKLDGTVLAGYGMCDALSFYLPPETGRLQLQVETRDREGNYTYANYELEGDDAPITYVQEDWGCGYQNRAGAWVFRWPWLVLEDVE